MGPTSEVTHGLYNADWTLSAPPTEPISPIIRRLDDEGFIWPSCVEIQAVQHQSQVPDSAIHDAEGLARINGRICIPATATALIQRFCVIAHCGSQGHRGRRVMTTHLSQLFEIPNIDNDQASFNDACCAIK